MGAGGTSQRAVGAKRSQAVRGAGGVHSLQKRRLGSGGGRCRGAGRSGDGEYEQTCAKTSMDML